MAANDWSAVVPYLSVLGLGVFREFAVMPRLVNSDYSAKSAEKGDVINVDIAPPVAVVDMVPSSTPYDAAGVTATKIPIQLNRWKQAPFKMTDKESMEAAAGILPMVARNAAIALAEYVNLDILGLYKEIWSFGGTPGTSPFGGSPPTTVDASQARKRLNIQKAFPNDRRIVLDPDAMANAIEVSAFQDASKSSDPMIITEGLVGRKLGFNWYEDQSVVTHTAGTVGGALTVTGANPIGTTTLNLSDAGSAFALKQGDKFTIAGDSTIYHVTADVTAAAATADVIIYPGLVAATSGAEVVTLKASYVANLAFQRECFAFANRPLAQSIVPSAKTNIRVETDPLTGVTIRLEVVRQNGQDLFRYDILYGIKTVYDDLGTIIAG